MRRMGALLAAGLIVASLALPIRAQESQESRDKAPPPVKLKSEKRAMTLSVVGTLVPLAVFASYFLGDHPTDTYANIASVGALVSPLGPSLGYFYAGSTGRGLLGIGIRLVGLAGIVGGGYGLDNGDANETLMTAFIIAGAGVTLASTVIDLAGVKKAVRRHNLKVQSLQVALAPIVVPRTRSFGLQARLSF
jgi:uncharacterized membrane protein YidH (DUF202 family)